jgi:hypothetical protein
LFYLNYSPEVHEGAYVNMLWILLGKLAGALGLSLNLMWHLARVGFGIVYFFAIIVTVNSFVEARAQRLIALVLAAFGSGIGWLLVLLGHQTIAGEWLTDFWLAEAYSTPTLVGFPHILLAIAMLLLTFVLAFKALETSSLAPSIIAGLCATLLVMIHPFAAATVDLTLVVYLLTLACRRKELPVRSMLLMVPVLALPIPALLYNLLVFVDNPAFRAWSEQNLCLSPSPILYLLGYGMLIPLAMLGALSFVSEGSEKGRFLLVWVLVVAVLLYVPFNSQRRFVEGTIAPLAILSARGIVAYIWPGLRRRGHARMIMPVTALIFALTIPSTLFFLVGLTSGALEHSPPSYQADSILKAMRWLELNTARDQVVLSSLSSGNQIPAIAGNTVVLGHWAETIHFEEEKQAVEAFFDRNTTDGERRHILERSRVSYLFYGPDERQLGDYDVESSPLLRRVYADGPYAIFEVVCRDNKAPD